MFKHQEVFDSVKRDSEKQERDDHGKLLSCGAVPSIVDSKADPNEVVNCNIDA